MDSEFEWKDADVGTGRQEVWKKSKEEIHGLGDGFFGHNNNSVPMYFIHQATSCHCDTRPIADLWTVELAILR